MGERINMQTHVFPGASIESVLNACRSVMKSEGYRATRASKGATWIGGTLGENATESLQRPQDLFINLESTPK